MKNIRNTKQKSFLIEYLKKNKNKHLMIQDIQSNLNNQIGLTTIYRIMNSLVKEGKVIKIPLDNKQGFCYQYQENQSECTSHYHLICEECGKMVHFKSNNVSKVIKEAKKDENFNINNQKVVFFGKCNKCENRSKNEK